MKHYLAVLLVVLVALVGLHVGGLTEPASTGQFHKKYLGVEPPRSWDVVSSESPIRHAQPLYKGAYRKCRQEIKVNSATCYEKYKVQSEQCQQKGTLCRARRHLNDCLFSTQLQLGGCERFKTKVLHDLYEIP